MTLYGYYLDTAALNFLSGAIQIAAIFMLLDTGVRVYNLAWDEWIHFPALAVFGAVACLYIVHPLNQPGAGVGLTEMAILHLTGWITKCSTDWLSVVTRKKRDAPPNAHFADDLTMHTRSQKRRSA